MTSLMFWIPNWLNLMEILTYNFVLGTGNIVGMLRIDSIEVPARCDVYVKPEKMYKNTKPVLTVHIP